MDKTTTIPDLHLYTSLEQKESGKYEEITGAFSQHYWHSSAVEVDWNQVDVALFPSF